METFSMRQHQKQHQQQQQQQNNLKNKRGHQQQPLAKKKKASSSSLAIVSFLFLLWLSMIITVTSIMLSTSSTTTTTTTTVTSRPIVECLVDTPNGDVTEEQSAHGTIRIVVHNDTSPVSSQIFLELVNAGYYNNVFIFRVLKNFVAQWGYRHSSDVAEPRMKITISKDTKDVVTDQTLSNLRGTLSFAGGNPFTKQVFVNLHDNTRLDTESRPFAVVEGMSILNKLHMEYKDGMGQIQTLKESNGDDGFVLQKFPYMSKIVSCHRLNDYNTR
jgi:cyclophilin family peptidyl-prolyl cis-trans isomerase